MKKKDVLKALGGVTATARALGISAPSVSGWGEEVPALRAYQLREKFPGLFDETGVARESAAGSAREEAGD